MNFSKKLLVVTLLTTSVFGVVSCGNKEDSTETDPYAVTKCLKLTKDFTNKCFIDDGIGHVSLVYATDGDTATFKLDKAASSGKDQVTIRFYNIDTPESTGAVEKWGKAASNYTKSKLENATDIVLEASTTPASVDSYGSRYLGYVWYKSSSSSEYYNLNLELVEQGYSDSSSVPENAYYNYFKSAVTSAKNASRHIWSKEDDPDYNPNPISTTIEEIVNDLESDSPTLFNEESNAGSKVSFEAYIKSVRLSSTFTYTAEALGTDGKPYQLTLFGGYSSDSINDTNKLGRIGGLFHIVGSIEKYNGSYQVAVGHTWQAIIGQKKDDETYLLEREYYMQFDSSNQNASDTTQTAVLSDLTVTSVSLENKELTVVGTAKNGTQDAVTYTIKVTLSKYSEVNSSKLKAGSKIKLSGIQEDKDSKIIRVLEDTLASYLK